MSPWQALYLVLEIEMSKIKPILQSAVGALIREDSGNCQRVKEIIYGLSLIQSVLSRYTIWDLHQRNDVNRQSKDINCKWRLIKVTHCLEGKKTDQKRSRTTHFKNLERIFKVSTIKK